MEMINLIYNPEFDAIPPSLECSYGGCALLPPDDCVKPACPIDMDICMVQFICGINV